MITIELSEADAAVLLHDLECLLSDTRMEIADTDSGFFREDVKTEKDILERVIAQLRSAVPA